MLITWWQGQEKNKREGACSNGFFNMYTKFFFCSFSSWHFSRGRVRSTKKDGAIYTCKQIEPAGELNRQTRKEKRKICLFHALDALTPPSRRHLMFVEITAKSSYSNERKPVYTPSEWIVRHKYRRVLRWRVRRQSLNAPVYVDGGDKTERKKKSLSQRGVSRFPRQSKGNPLCRPLAGQLDRGGRPFSI